MDNIEMKTLTIAGKTYKIVDEQARNEIDELKNTSTENGATFTPSVSSSGVLSWTNDKNLENPQAVNIKGPKGDPGGKGDKGDKGDPGDSRLPAVTTADNDKLVVIANGGYTIVSLAESPIPKYIDDYINEALGGDY